MSPPDLWLTARAAGTRISGTIRFSHTYHTFYEGFFIHLESTSRTKLWSPPHAPSREGLKQYAHVAAQRAYKLYGFTAHVADNQGTSA